MKSADGYRRFEDLMFQELEARQRMATQAAIDESIQYAGTKGFTLDQLIHMADSGMSGREVWIAVHSG